MDEMQFLSTPSGWRATSKAPEFCIRIIISIHALRVEGDRFLSHFSGGHPRDFYPRPPGGGRHFSYGLTPVSSLISIHALRVEGDAPFIPNSERIKRFLSTPSGWRATEPPEANEVTKKFLSTPSGWRATDLRRPRFYSFCISIHALRVEGDAYEELVRQRFLSISIHALRVEGDVGYWIMCR